MFLHSAYRLFGGRGARISFSKRDPGNELIIDCDWSRFSGNPRFSKKNLDYVLTEAHTNTFSNVSIFERIELLNYL